MAKTITDAEIEAVRRETAARDAVSPRVKDARYERQSGLLVLEMVGGATIHVPARSLRDLAGASDEQLADVQPEENGNAVFWDALDVQMSTIALLQIIFGIRTISDVARQAGRTTSEAKAIASRANGLKGGRPRKRARADIAVA